MSLLIADTVLVGGLAQRRIAPDQASVCTVLPDSMLSSIKGINLAAEASGMCRSRIRSIPRPSSSTAATISDLPAIWRPSTPCSPPAQIALVDFDPPSQPLTARTDH